MDIQVVNDSGTWKHTTQITIWIVITNYVQTQTRLEYRIVCHEDEFGARKLDYGKWFFSLLKFQISNKSNPWKYDCNHIFNLSTISKIDGKRKEIRYNLEIFSFVKFHILLYQ